MSLRDWWVQILARRGRLPAPDPAAARAAQERVSGDVHSRRVALDPRAMEWQAAAACAERGLYGAAAEWVIRATNPNGTCRLVEVEHG